MINRLYALRRPTVAAVLCQEVLRNAVYNWDGLPLWVHVACNQGDVILGEKELLLQTNQGLVPVAFDQWIVRYADGHMEAMSRQQFMELYEPVKEEDPNG